MRLGQALVLATIMPRASPGKALHDPGPSLPRHPSIGDLDPCSLLHPGLPICWAFRWECPHLCAGLIPPPPSCESAFNCHLITEFLLGLLSQISSTYSPLCSFFPRHLPPFNKHFASFPHELTLHKAGNRVSLTSVLLLPRTGSATHAALSVDQ